MGNVISVTFGILALFHAARGFAGDRPLPAACTYETQHWSVALKRSVDARTVSHPYSELAGDEVDPATGCTVCREDQERVVVPPLEPFFLCHKIATRVRAALEGLLRSGAPVFEVVGYHVIRSRGPVDGAGNRTGFSNHSYGTAVDVNPELNGLYDHCLEFGPRCRLVRGGEWRPGVRGTLEEGGDIVRAFTSLGLRWGGELAGRQKDFMHFSMTGVLISFCPQGHGGGGRRKEKIRPSSVDLFATSAVKGREGSKMFLKHLKDCDEFVAGDDSVLRELLHPDKADLRLRYSLAHAVVRPGQTTRPHRLKTSEVYYILEGEGVMHINDESSHLRPGHAVYIPPRARQFIHNPGKNDLLFLCIVDPAWRKEDEEVL